jgi:hypothetical protein
MELCWHEFGLALQKARTASDLVKAFDLLRKYQWADNYLHFFSSEKTAVSSGSPYQMRRAMLELQRIREQAYDLQASCDEGMKIVAEAREAFSQAEKNRPEMITKVKRELISREKELESRRAKLAKTISKRASFEKKLNQEGAFVSQSELLSFLKSKRYAINPRNVANAIAGLPFLTWRQSLERCKKIKCTLPESHEYCIFKAICYILRKKQPRFADTAQKFFQLEIEKLPAEHEYAKTFLAKNWWYLKSAIEACWKTEVFFSRDIRYKLTDTFLKKIRNKTPLDSVLAELEEKSKANDTNFRRPHE